MRHSFLIFSLIITLFSIWLSGCAKKALMRKYYVLEPVMTIDTLQTKKQPLPYDVECKNLKIAKAFNQTRIAIRLASHELNYYFYHHWAVRPSSAVSDFIFNIIQQKECFQKCQQGYLSNPDYYITGEVIRLERLIDKKDEFAHIAGKIQLLNTKNESEIMVHTFDKKISITKNNSMNHFASAISQILSKETESFINKVRNHFEPPEKN